MRNLYDIIKNILDCIPKGKCKSLCAALKEIQDSIITSAPEMMSLHWNRTYEILTDENMYVDVNEETIKKIASIWNT